MHLLQTSVRTQRIKARKEMRANFKCHVYSSQCKFYSQIRDMGNTQTNLRVGYENGKRPKVAIGRICKTNRRQSRGPGKYYSSIAAYFSKTSIIRCLMRLPLNAQRSTRSGSCDFSQSFLPNVFHVTFLPSCSYRHSLDLRHNWALKIVL